MIFATIPLGALIQFAILRNDAPMAVKFLPALFASAVAGMGYLTNDLACSLYGAAALVGIALGAMFSASRSGN